MQHRINPKEIGNVTHPVMRYQKNSFYTKKGSKALEKAKQQELTKIDSGKKWVLLPDGKTKVLR